MIINTEKLLAVMDSYYAEQASKIDETTKNNQIAIRRLTQIETRQLREIDAINKVCEVARVFGCIEKE